MARITAGVTTSHVPAIGATIDHGRTAEPYWAPMFAGLRVLEALDGGAHARRRDPRLQRPCVGVQPRHRAHVRDRLRRQFPAGRRGLGTAAGACRAGPSGARCARRAVRDPAGLRPDLRLQDGRRPRAHRAALAPLRPARRMAMPRHPARGQRRALPAAVRTPLLRARQGDTACGRVLRRGPRRADLGHRRHEPPAAGAPRRTDQLGVGCRVHRSPDRRTRRASPRCRTSSTCARRARKASSS